MYVGGSRFRDSGGQNAVNHFEGAPQRQPAPPPTLLRQRVRPPNEEDPLAQEYPSGRPRAHLRGVRLESHDGGASDTVGNSARGRGAAGGEVDTVSSEQVRGLTLEDVVPGDLRATHSLLDAIHCEYRLDNVVFKERPLWKTMVVRRKYVATQMQKYWGDGPAQL